MADRVGIVMMTRVWRVLQSEIGRQEVMLLAGVCLTVAAAWPDLGQRALAIPGGLCLALVLLPRR